MPGEAPTARVNLPHAREARSVGRGCVTQAVTPCSRFGGEGPGPPLQVIGKTHTHTSQRHAESVSMSIQCREPVISFPEIRAALRGEPSPLTQKADEAGLGPSRSSLETPPWGHLSLLEGRPALAFFGQVGPARGSGFLVAPRPPDPSLRP